MSTTHCTSEATNCTSKTMLTYPAQSESVSPVPRASGGHEVAGSTTWQDQEDGWLCYSWETEKQKEVQREAIEGERQKQREREIQTDNRQWEKSVMKHINQNQRTTPSSRVSGKLLVKVPNQMSLRNSNFVVFTETSILALFSHSHTPRRSCDCNCNSTNNSNNSSRTMKEKTTRSAPWKQTYCFPQARRRREKNSKTIEDHKAVRCCILGRT